MSKIAVVGCQASGKTVFMAALADYYRPNQRVNQLCCMTPENANANRFSEVMIHQMRDLHEWPSATNAQRTMSLKWAMRRGSEVIAQIEMLDFGGEVFRAAFDEGTPQNQDAVRQLVDYLVDANFIVVLVSLAELSRDINRTATDGEVVLDAESKWVTRGLLDLLKEHQAFGSKVIVALTQADRPEHKRMLETYGGPKGVFAKAWPIVSAVHPDVKVISVASVSNTTMDNRPADGFKTDGVLSVMKEFTQHQFGDCDGLSQTLAEAASNLQSMSAISSPAAFTRKLNEFDSLLAKLYKETAVIAELYKTDFQNYERLKSTCLEFVNVIEKVERRPLDSQVNGAFWREQEQLYPSVAGTIRSFERYYQRKVEQQNEERIAAEKAKREEEEKRLEAERLSAERASKARSFFIRMIAVGLVLAAIVGIAFYYYSDKQAKDRQKEIELFNAKKDQEARMANENAAENARIAEANARKQAEERRIAQEAEAKKNAAAKEIDGLLDELRQAVSNDDLELAREKSVLLKRKFLTSYQKSVVKVCDDFCDHLEKANNGNVDSQLWIASQHAEPKSVVKQDRAKAVEWYEKAANSGSAAAMLELAYWAEDGIGGRKDDARAIKWYVKAARAKSGDAMYRLGVFYSMGLMGLEKSQDKAYVMFKNAKDNGCTFTNVDEWLDVIRFSKSSSFWGGLLAGDDLDDVLKNLESASR